MPIRTRQEQEAFERALQSVRGEAPLSVDELDALSALEPPFLDRYAEVWRTLGSDAKRGLLNACRAAADERLRLDFSALNRLALDDEDAAVRLAGVQAALEDRGAPLLRRLLDMVRSDPSQAVREAAANDAARFALLAELEDLNPELTRVLRETLLAAVNDPGESAEVRSAALASLGYFSDSEVAGLLASSFTDPELRVGAVRGMGRGADPRWTDRLLPLLGSNDPRQRLEAAVALGEIEDDRAVGPLSEVIDDPDERVRLAVIQALGAIGGDEAREALLYLLEDKDDVIREAGERAIRELEFYEDPLGL